MKIGKDIQRSSKDCQRSLYKKRYIIHYNPSSNQPQDLSSIEILHSSDHPSMDPPMAIRILAHYLNKGCFLKSWGNTPQIIYFRIFMDCRWNQPYQPSSYIGVPPCWQSLRHAALLALTSCCANSVKVSLALGWCLDFIEIPSPSYWIYDNRIW
jgi:hypothetical protein